MSVWEYLKGAAGDGTLVQASLVTMRRLLAGYIIGIAVGLPLGLLTARFKFCEDTLGVLALGLQTLPERLLGAAGAALVRANGNSDAFHCHNGHTLVGDHRDRQRRSQRATDLCPRRADNGLEAAAHLVQSHPAGVTAIHRQRHETRLGVRVAVADGCGDLRDDFDRLWAGPFAALRPRIKCDGPGYRRHVCHRRHRSARGQNCVRAVGTLSTSAMGHGTSLNEPELSL